MMMMKIGKNRTWEMKEETSVHPLHALTLHFAGFSNPDLCLAFLCKTPKKNLRFDM